MTDDEKRTFDTEAECRESAVFHHMMPAEKATVTHHDRR